MSRRVSIPRSEITRFVRAVAEAGQKVTGVEVDIERRSFIVHTDDAVDAGNPASNPWDKVLTNGAKARAS